MLDFEFLLPTQIYFQNNAINFCKEKIETIIPQKSKIMVCIGQGSVKKNGIFKKIYQQLNNYEIVLFEEIEPNPTIQKAEEGLKFARINKIQAIIALGGGSVLDTAKAIATAYTNQISIQALWDGKIKIQKKCLPLITIPTTPATSSELNQYSVLTDEKGIKKGFGYKPYMCPDLAMIDPALLLSLPILEKQASLCDILAHAIESSWSKKSTYLYKFFAHNSIELVLEFGEKWIKNSKSIEIAEKISLASVFAGFAFSHTGTTVSHAISYPLTIYHQVKHGLGCGITLPIFYEYFEKDQSIAELNNLLKVNNALNGSKKLKLFLARIGVPTKLSQINIKKRDLKKIIETSYPFKNDVNPVKISKQHMRILLGKIL